MPAIRNIVSGCGGSGPFLLPALVLTAWNLIGTVARPARREDIYIVQLVHDRCGLLWTIILMIVSLRCRGTRRALARSL